MLPTTRPTAGAFALAAILLTSAQPAIAQNVTESTAQHAASENAVRENRAVPVRYLEQTIHWKRCFEPDHVPPLLPPGSERLECGSFNSPRNWNRPEDKVDVTIAVSRLRPETGEPRGSVLTNPGGPGGPGRTLPLVFLRQERAKLLNNVEVLGFDPRGTGESSKLTCADGTQIGANLDARDRGKDNLDLILDSTQLMAKYCQVSSGELGRYVNTEQTVKDLDLLRVLLGREKVSWIGYSAGTWMGAYYATYFPNRVDKFVFDSNTEFTASWQASFEQQPLGFERRFREDFLPWVATYDNVYHLGATPEDVRQTYERLRATLAESPTPAPTGNVGPNQFDTLIVKALYNKRTFPALAAAIAAMGQIVEAAANAVATPDVQESRTVLAHYLQEFEVSPRRLGPQPVAADAFEATFNAITCNDTSWRRDWNALLSDSYEMGVKYPLLGWGWLEQPCAFWNRPSLTMPTPTGKGVPPVLMVQSAHDPATPIEGAQRAHSAFAGSRLLTVTNEGDHGVYAGGNACVDAVVEAFVVDARVPDDDVTCAGLPLPTPPEVRAEDGGPVSPIVAAAQLRKLTGPLPR
jgi:pimeloyl-ACP methyl ester carboxylesterase